MRAVKVLGLALAMTWLAVLAISAPASATVLCEKEEEACANPIPSGTTIKGETEEAGVFESESGMHKTKCNSTLTAKTTSSGGKEKPVTAEISAINYSSCTGTCSSATTLDLPYPASITATGGGKGKMTVEGKGGGEVEVELSCQLPPPIVVACVYGSATEVWSVEPGHPGHTVKTQVSALVSGPLSCDPALVLRWRYRINSPQWIFAY